MKRKNKFLTVISSLLGVFGLCGAFCCSLLFSSTNEVIQTSADDDENTTLSIFTQSGLSQTISYVSDDSKTVVISYDYYLNYTFNKTTGVYSLSYTLDWYLYCDVGVNRYSVYYNTNKDKFHNTKIIESTTLYPLDTRVYFEFTRMYPNQPVFGSYIGAYSYVFQGEYVDVIVGTGRLFENGQTVSTSNARTYSVYFQAGEISVYPFDTLITYDNDVRLYLLGYEDAYNNGYNEGYSGGYNDGYNVGYNSGYQDGVNSQSSAIQDAYQQGRTDGYNEGFNADSTAITIMTGIFQVALVPINFFLGMFNFNILGINLASVIQAIFTLAVTVILVKAVIGGKGDK